MKTREVSLETPLRRCEGGTDLSVGNTCDFDGVEALLAATSLASEMKVAQTWIAIGPSKRER